MPEYIEREVALQKVKKLQRIDPAVIGTKQFAEGYFAGLDELEVILRGITTVDAVEVVRCAYCDPGSQDYNPCWLCKKGGTAHDVEHCHETNYGDYEPMQPHCHLCGRKL